MKTWTKRFVAVFCCVVMMLTSIYISEPQPVSAATSVDVYDFNGTDFSTALLDGEGSGPLTSANRAVLLTDTSGVPEGFTAGVYGGGKNGAYASVPVDFAKPIDLSKVTSIKVRMYANGTSISNDKLRILSGDNTTSGTYEEWAFDTYGAPQTWCEIDITDILNNPKLANAKDENGYLDRFIIAARLYGNTTTCYFDSIIIEGENYFVESGDIYDFNGTDFSTALLDGEGSGSNPLSSAYLVTSLADTSGVPEGFTDGVYGGGGSNYASIPVDFAKPIDLSKVTSIKVRMYVTEYKLSGTPKLRILSQDNTTGGTYTETSYTDAGITFGQWCEVDITDELNSSNIAKDENGYLDRFILAYRVYGSTTPTCYFDHISIVGEDYFVSTGTEEPDKPTEPDFDVTEFTDVTISNFVDASRNQMAEKAYGYYGGEIETFYLKDHTSFEGMALSMNVKYAYGDYYTRIDVAGSGAWSGLMVYPNKTGTHLFIIANKDNYGVSDSLQIIEVAAITAGVSSFIDHEFHLKLTFDFGTPDSNNQADLKLGVYINGALYNNQTYIITNCNMAKFGNYIGLYRENEASVITISSAASEPETERVELTIDDFVDDSGNQMEAKEYSYISEHIETFHLREHANFDNSILSMRVKYQYGTGDTRIHIAGNGHYSGLMIYPNAEGTYLFIVASQEYAGTASYQAVEIAAAKAEVTSFLDKDFLLQLEFDFGDANSSKKADLKLKVIINGTLYNNQTFTITGCDMTYFGNCMSLYRTKEASAITVSPVDLDPIVYDFNGTDFDTTVYASEGIGSLKPANLATLLTDTSAVPEGFSDGVYGGGSSEYASVPICFPQQIDLAKVFSIKVRMYVPAELESAGTTFRLLTNEETASGVTYPEANYADLGGTYGAWSEVDITSMLKDSKTVKDDNGYMGRFIIAFRTRVAATCYFDSVIIDGVEYFVPEEGTFRDVTIEKISLESSFNTQTDAWDIYPMPERPTNVPGVEGETTFEAIYEIDGNSYSGTFTRADNTKGLYLTIPKVQLPSDADGVLVTIKAGEYKPNSTTAGIRIVNDYMIYIHNGALTQYEGENQCEADYGASVIDHAENVEIDGVAVTYGQEYTNSGIHLLTYSIDGYTYSKHLIIYHFGDINDDNTIGATDLVAMKKYIAQERSVTKAGEKAADMNADDEVTSSDTKLLRKRLITDSGALVLCPTDGRIVARAHDVAESLLTNYYVGKADEFGTEPMECVRDVTTLKWISFENVDNYTVKLATKKDMSDAIHYTTTDCSLELINLLVDTDYYWTVEVGEYVSDVQTFHTQDTIRTLTVEGVSNIRDGGGWATLDGQYVKQGMFYRGGKLDLITEAGKDVMLNQLDIYTDLDLRNNDEANGLGSPLGNTVQYLNYSGPYYWDDTRGINAKEYQEALRNEIKTFANPENYPIYVHCSIGRDRTGTLCFLINALLGVDEQSLCMDYELSTLYLSRADNGSAAHMTSVFKDMYNHVQAYAPNGTMAEATESFMLSIGVTQDEIDSIREILLEEQ